MTFIEKILEPPSYGWQDEDGKLIIPLKKEIISEFWSRMNILKSKKNWLSFTSWFWALALLPFLLFFIFKYFSLWLLLIGFLYSMVGMGTFGTIWYHRYATHKSYSFSHPFWQYLTQNMVIKALPDEIYVVSHHVHHSLSDKPGDPYNAAAGWLYCFLADSNHQLINRKLSVKEYRKVASLLKNTGVKINTFAQYQKWGSVSNPFWTWLLLIINWSFWYVVFFLIGGIPLVCCLFGAAFIWVISVRTFNYQGHGKGINKRKEGVDFNHKDLSINGYWPGYVAGEWHNNHHLYPASARSGFMPLQIDLPWYYIRFLYAIGGVSRYNDSKRLFMENYYFRCKKNHHHH